MFHDTGVQMLGTWSAVGRTTLHDVVPTPTFVQQGGSFLYLTRPVTFVICRNQMYPNAGPSTLLHRFFKLMAGWNWPNAIQLVQPYDAGLGLEVKIGVSHSSREVHTPEYILFSIYKMNAVFDAALKTIYIYSSLWHYCSPPHVTRL